MATVILADPIHTATTPPTTVAIAEPIVTTLVQLVATLGIREFTRCI